MTSALPARRYLDRSAHALLQAQAPPRRALFLDRDGVINVDHGYVSTPAQTTWIPGIFALCRDAHAAGYLPVVVTNQAGIARGHYTEAQFLAFTAWIHGEFRRRDAPLLATYYCPHHPTAGRGEFRCACDCRKPAPGMLLRAGRDLDLDMAGSVLVGDKASDLAAAAAAGVGAARLFEPSAANDGLPGFESLIGP